MNVPNIVVGGHWTCKECGTSNISSVDACVRCRTPRRGKAHAESVNSAPGEEQDPAETATLRSFTLQGEDEIMEAVAGLELRCYLLQRAMAEHGEGSETFQELDSSHDTVQSILERIRREVAQAEVYGYLQNETGKAVANGRGFLDAMNLVRRFGTP